MKRETNVIVGIDLSLRHTGIAKMFRNKEGRSVSLRLGQTNVINLPKDSSITGLDAVQDELKNIDRLYNLIMEYCRSATDIIIEVPTGKATKFSAHSAGVCLGVVAMIQRELSHKTTLVGNHALKKWSGSKRGDKKNKVKEIVQSQTGVTIENDNILDAIGLCLIRANELSLKNQY